MDVSALLDPKNVVIVGASERAGSWSQNVYRSLMTAGFDRPIHPVNPRVSEVWGLPCSASVAQIPEPPDQLLVLVPAERVVDVIEEGVAAGARSAVVYASGFGEDGSEEGRARAAALKELVASSGIAVVGPNCLGYASYPARAVALTNEAAPSDPRNCHVAVLAQSGGVALSLNRVLVGRRLAPRYLVSSGNELGLTVEDYLEYFIDDPSVRTIALFIESVKDSPRFVELIKRSGAAGKPVVAMKMGGSDSSRRAALAHTGRLAGSKGVFDDITQIFGALSVDSLDELIDAVDLLARGRSCPSPRVGAVTVSGGLRGIICDAASRWQLELPELEPETVAALSAIVGVGTAVGNPMDTGFTGLSSRESLESIIGLMAADKNIDNLIVQQRLPEATRPEPRWAAMRAVAEAADSLPGSTMVTDGFVSLIPGAEGFGRLTEYPGVAYASSIDSGMRALSRLARRAQWLERAKPLLNGGEGPAAVSGKGAPARGGGGNHPRDELEAKALCAEYGLRVPAREVVAGPAQVADALESVGLPLIIKATVDGVVHKAKAGLVSGALWSPDVVMSEFERIHGKALSICPPDGGVSVYLEQFIAGGVECAIGATRDEEFGMVMMFGSGGGAVEILKDVTFFPVDIEGDLLLAALQRTKVGQWVLGDGSAYDRQSVLDAVGIVQRIVADTAGELESLDINPMVVLPEGGGTFVLDAAWVARA